MKTIFFFYNTFCQWWQLVNRAVGPELFFQRDLQTKYELITPSPHLQIFTVLKQYVQYDPSSTWSKGDQDGALRSGVQKLLKISWQGVGRLYMYSSYLHRTAFLSFPDRERLMIMREYLPSKCWWSCRCLLFKGWWSCENGDCLNGVSSY